MLEVRNKSRSPIQIVVRSRKAPRAFTTLNIPGIGAGKNVVYIDDERKTEYIDRIEDWKLITTRYIPNKEFEKIKESEKGA